METKYRKALSERESRILSELSYRNKGIFTLNDLDEFVQKPKNFLHHLIEKNWILKARRGIYIIVPLEAGSGGASDHTVHSFAIASSLVEPYYIGFWSALNYHGLTDQIPSVIYIATTKLRHSRNILDNKFVFVKVHQRKMFGVDKINIEKMQVAISSPEKTIVDCLDHPEHAGGLDEVAKAFYFSKKELDAKKIVEYAKKIGNTAVIKRLGFITEVFGWDDYIFLLSSAKIKSGYSLLDPTIPKTGHIREKWKVVVNITIDPKKWMQ
ncbi:MAG: type IV toxin-antitoxin system AbiEi family antitoxin [Candidatus Nitrosotalea sp.]|nr:type IV toxin-antitoxin system AbiEi family antitoxin [Candidatus Nitrosotalea sp.]